MTHASFLLDVYGEFARGQVRVAWHEASGAEDPQVERLKADWPRHVEEVVGRGGVLFNGQMVRYLGHRLETDTLVIDAGPTDYATFYCTNYLNHLLGDLIGWDRFSNPLGISANVITSDGWLLYGRRGERVACHPNTIHAFGGTLEPGDRDAAGELDVFASMARELAEELHLPAEEICELICLGIVRDPELRQPELVFDATVSRTRAELESRIGPHDPEHISIAACRDQAEPIAEFLRQSPPVPCAIGSLCLHVRRRFGDAVFTSLRSLPA